MSADNRLRRFVIVGGGTAGWMSAVMLNRLIGGRDREITLVESDAIGTIGVGEATVPPLVRYLREMEIDESDFMRRCHGTYKLGIQFENWHASRPAFSHPFGVIGGLIDALPVFHHWADLRRNGLTDMPYDGLAPNSIAALEGRAPRSPLTTSSIAERGAYAYHLDAGAFAELLRDTAMARGVRRVVDEVREVRLDARGHIASLSTAGGAELAGDFFIDCSGFRGLLMERALKDRWIDWSGLLLCDRAAAMPLRQGGEYPPYTRAAAQPAGWTWRIPLSHRIGSGYVFSSAHSSDDEAVAVLRRAADGATPAADPFFLDMRVGRRESFWRGNCLAVGLSAGFLEPLESTGIYFIQAALKLFAHYFPDRDFEPMLIRRYNRRMAEKMAEVRDFILLHYALSSRPGEPFWEAARSVTLPDSLKELVALYRRNGLVETETNALFPDTSYYAILGGLGYLPQAMHPRAALSARESVVDILRKIQAQNREVVDAMPDHFAALQGLHGDDLPAPT